MLLSFGDVEIDADRRELRRAGTLVHVEPQVFDVLLHLVRNCHRVVSKDELLNSIWDSRFVSEATLSSRISAARKALGDSGTTQSLIRTVNRRGFRFLGEVQERTNDPVSGPAALPPSWPQRARVELEPQQEVAFCRTSDAVNLAMATVGTGTPLVKTANWLNHIEFDWQSPVWSPLFALLAAKHRLIRYDERGNGMSDWNVPDFCFESYVRDLEAVVDAQGLRHFALFGISQGAA